MAKNKENTGAQHAIVPADKRQLQRQPDESEKALKARIAYCKLEPSQRTIAAAYRAFKGMEPDAEVKVPGYFGAWAKRFRWKEYAIAWDAYFNDIVATRRDEQMAAARRETVEQAQLQLYQTGDRAAERSRPAPPLVARHQRRQNSRTFTPGYSTQGRISRPPCSAGRNSPRP